MNKQEFLKELKRKLGKLKREECNKYMEYYDEIISDIMDRGVSEEDAIKKQGSIDRIARDILANTNPANLKSKDWGGIVLVVASFILLFSCIAPLLLKMQFDMSMSGTVSVIGGADGPTSIFVAGKIGPPWGLCIATVVVVMVTILHFVKKRR